MGEKSQTLLVRKERCVENPWLWNNEEVVVSFRSQTSHELICAIVSAGSAGKHQREELLSGSLRVEDESGEKSNSLVRFLMT